MNLDQMKSHCLEFGALYAFLLQDTAKRKHDPNAHNLCSAIVEVPGAQSLGAIYSYSNPSALKGSAYEGYEFIIGDGIQKIINRSGMQDLHTEIRLLNFLYANQHFNDGTIINFFSSRSVCATCRSAIYDVMEKMKGKVGIMVYEFKVEKYGSMTEFVYPIHQDRDYYNNDIGSAGALIWC